MAKVKWPLFSGDASGAFGKKMIFRRGGVVSKMFWPRNPRSALQQAQRQAFKEFSLAGLTQEQADLLYAAILHLHEEDYAALVHAHDHGALGGLGDDDHPQYLTQTEAGSLYSVLSHLHASSYSALGHEHSFGMVLPASGLNGTIVAGGTMYLPFFYYGLNTIAYGSKVPGAGVVKNLRITISTSQPSSGSLVITLLKESAPTNVVATIPLSSALGEYTDLTHSVVVAGGDRMVLKCVNNAGAISAQIGAGLAVFEGSTTG